MDKVSIAKTARSPAVEFDFGANTYSLAGESYPEDVSAFYGPLVDKIKGHLAGQKGAKVAFRFQFDYFNSSSSKVVMELFEILDGAAAKGNTVKITWAYQEDDDNLLELGQEFAEELKKAEFALETL